MSEINYEVLDEALDYIEAVDEGVNADLMSKSSSFRKDIREFNKEYRSIIRNKEDADRFNKARKLVDDFKNGTVKEYKEFIKGLDSSETSDKVVGGMIGVLYTLSQCAWSILAVTASAIGLKMAKKRFDAFDSDMYKILLGMDISTAAVTAGKTIADDVEALRNNYEHGGDKKANYYMVKCLAYADNIEKQLEGIKKYISRVEAKVSNK